MPRLVPCPSCRRHLFTAEPACPHCGTSGAPFIAALAVVVASSLAACTSSDSGPVAVYGPPQQDPDQRQPSASASATASETAAPPAPPVDVYGPPPRDADQRQAPSTSASQEPKPK